MTDIFKSADWAREAEEKKRRAKGLFTGPTGQALVRVWGGRGATDAPLTPTGAFWPIKWLSRDEAEKQWPSSPVEEIDWTENFFGGPRGGPPGGSMKDGSE